LSKVFNAKQVVKLLRERYGSIDQTRFIAQYVKGRGLFEFTLAVILSQNTSDLNAIKAYEKLRELTGGDITPDKVLNTPLDELIEALKPAGLQNIRAQRIIELARFFNNSELVERLVKELVELPVEDARLKLMDLPGVGRKTADVILLMYFNKPSFPVDTHITRITKRLGVVNRVDYEAIRRFWMENLNPGEYLEAHLLLITHGRLTCKARKPVCKQCVIRDYCNYYARRRL